MPVAEAVFRKLTRDCFERIIDDSLEAEQNSAGEISENPFHSRGERVALNFMQRMTGIATQTREFVGAPRGLIWRF